MNAGLSLALNVTTRIATLHPRPPPPRPASVSAPARRPATRSTRSDSDVDPNPAPLRERDIVLLVQNDCQRIDRLLRAPSPEMP